MFKNTLLEKLTAYTASDMLPMHMPGHKRKAFPFPNPYSIDITEIPGFDNLHAPEDILMESMTAAAKIYDSASSIYLVNGSTCGILAAIRACTCQNGHILLARNAHISAFHAAELSGLHITNLIPENIEGFNICGSISPEKVLKALASNQNISAVLLVSPTYEGVISDIKTISDICHSYKVPLIVDEAHGAHLPFSNALPPSAIHQGADIVIQSLHKTLPCFTQTAIMHINSELVTRAKLLHNLHIFETSSPSYLFLTAIEECIKYMHTEGKILLQEHIERVSNIRSQLLNLKNIRLLTKTANVYSLDTTRISLFTPKDARLLDAFLRDSQHIQTEMSLSSHIVAITTLCDSSEDLTRLLLALQKADEYLNTLPDYNTAGLNDTFNPKTGCTIADALCRPTTNVPLKQSIGQLCGEYIYAYPPGIPVILPGEIITNDICSTLVHLGCRNINSDIKIIAPANL